jgi:nucleosome binding factor SPN SPT16 subunit
VANQGMIFQVSIGFSDLINPEAKEDEAKKYALFIGDTILVNKDAAATALTLPKKKIENIAIFVKEDDEEEEGSDHNF